MLPRGQLPDSALQASQTANALYISPCVGAHPPPCWNMHAFMLTFTTGVLQYPIALPHDEHRNAPNQGHRLISGSFDKAWLTQEPNCILPGAHEACPLKRDRIQGKCPQQLVKAAFSVQECRE